jgi:hypothetical protein
LPKTTIPEKWFRYPTNYQTSRFEIIPPTSSAGAIEDNEREEIAERAQRDSAEKTLKFGLNKSEAHYENICARKIGVMSLLVIGCCYD